MINQSSIKPLLIALALIAASFFFGRYAEKNAKVSEINSYQLRIATDSLKFEMKKQSFEFKTKEIHYEMSIRQSKIDTAGLVYIDSLWKSHGL